MILIAKLLTENYTNTALCSALCWSDTRATVLAPIVPSPLCARYEGSPLCEQKTFFLSLSHLEAVWTGTAAEREPGYKNKICVCRNKAALV